MRYLKTNTATVITVGPFLDKTDGITPKTALTVTNCHLTLMVDNAGTPTLALDANATASGGNNDMVHITNDDAGMYSLELAAANVNYLGGAILAITDAANHCPVFHEFTILPAVNYDAFIAGTDNFDVSVTQIAGAAVSTSTAQLGVNVVSNTGNSGVKKNTALAGFMFQMFDSTNHAPATSKTVSANRSLDGAAFGACANAVAEISNGWYKISLAAGDLNGNTVALRFSATGCDDTSLFLVTGT